ncbi:MAG TPA: GNAT family protein [Allosphingosinicella sp.]|uniref:GNAT family N-acetyltransferase n=1 Tax=Allosphingosinicella sp. TaxID=2823234 RepID=UPI002ED7E227
MQMKPRVLEGRHVRLEPVEAAHEEEMRETLSSDPDIWQIYSQSGYGEHFPAFWRKMIATPDRIAYAVRHKETGRLAGTSSLLKIDLDHRKLEIGFTFFRPEHRGTAVNPEAKLLMLDEAFGAGAYRVQFSVDMLNARSQAAVLKLGATREGTVRSHLITWTGRRRDTALFSILDEEWPEVEQRLKERLLKFEA